jgi:DNA-directed RNA polymerase specialized sigma54-like protein
MCGLVSPDSSVRCECGFLLAALVMTQQAIELLQLSRKQLADTIRDEILANPILDDALDIASEVPEAADALSTEHAGR